MSIPQPTSLDEVEELRASVHLLKKELDARDEFLAMVSHELKTPITAVKMKFQMGLRFLRRSPPDQAHASLAKLLADGDHQVNRLVRLLDNLLDASRSRSGTLRLQLEDVELGELVREVAERFRESFAHAGVQLRTEVAVGIHGTWDRERLNQVLTNLFSNSLRYAPGRPLAVTATGDRGGVWIEVRDQGPGISLAHQQKIFDRYERGAAQNGGRGMGLGLFVSREIMQAHGGSIHVESREGQGASFHLYLPATARNLTIAPATST